MLPGLLLILADQPGSLGLLHAVALRRMHPMGHDFSVFVEKVLDTSYPLG